MRLGNPISDLKGCGRCCGPGWRERLSCGKRSVRRVGRHWPRSQQRPARKGQQKAQELFQLGWRGT